ncbi:MAG TPA: RNA 2',3'-cyclic phosphodiesterase [Myxococcales bacterium]|nr:RNA 2',3'-cyclic phosphodiesterase [Myxococcales bacterium]
MRLFFSVPLPEKARTAAAAVLRTMQRAAGEKAPLSWTREEQLHFTIAFLGELPEDALPRLTAAAAPCAELRSFNLELRGAGAFPNPRRPRVLWLGVGDGAQQLEQVAGRLCGGLREGGFTLEERPFRGHLTVARVRPGGERSVSRALRAVPPGAIAMFTVERLCLMQSQLSPHGAKHTLVHETRLS